MLETVAGFQLSPQQERLWLLQERDAGTSAYRAQCVVRFDGNVAQRLLEAAVSSVIERHEILRTRFQSTAGHVLAAPGDHRSRRHASPPRSRRLPAQEQQAAHRRVVGRGNGASFDLTLATVVSRRTRAADQFAVAMRRPRIAPTNRSRDQARLCK